MKNFAITGIAGYIAPRHLKAIKETNNNLVAAVDPHDSVGIVDQYFPKCSFFTQFERFDRHLEKLRREADWRKVDYVSICSPNYLHDAHIRFALRLGADAICEKPLVLNPWNLDQLEDLENEFGKRVYTILQLRVHPSILKLHQKIKADKSGRKHRVDLTYITARGTWYNYSWKGRDEQSGGIATNIGIHFFDLLIWLFGSVQKSEVHSSCNKKMGGFIELQNAYVNWFLSIDENDLIKMAKRNGHNTYRSIIVDGEELEFTDGFTDLHTRVYEQTLTGKGFGIEDVRPSINLVFNLRNASLTKTNGNVHPIVKSLLEV